MLKEVIMMIQHIDDYNQFKEAIKEGITLVDFFATWCSPCRMLTPIVEEYSEKNETIKVIKVDVDKAHELATEYGVYSIPTLLIVKDGEEIARRLGYMPLEILEDFVEENLTK